MTADARLASDSDAVMDDASAQVTRSYAEAIINAADKDGQVDAVLDDLEAIRADVLVANPRFAALLGSSAVPAEQKDRILSDAFGGRVHETALRFLRVLNRHGRLGLLGPIIVQSRAAWDRRQNRIAVSVRSAVPLDEGQQEGLRARLAGLTGGTPVLRLEVDPALIGGLVVQVGDDRYDASVRSRLQQLRGRIIASGTADATGRRGLVEA